MSFFNKNELNLKAETQESTGLRNCQLGAYWATLSHFITSKEPCLVSMPTGSGKTELMQLLCFHFEPNRVLVTTPSKLLKDQLAERFELLSKLKQLEVIGQNVGKPRVFKVGSKRNHIDKWSELIDSDIVVATPHTISSEIIDVVPPLSDLFDLIFIDEAHHTPAKTWRSIINDFPNSRIIMLTATPFRHDNVPLKVPIIFHYPIAKAIETGIYREITYHRVLEEQDLDIKLIEKTHEIFQSLKTDNYSPKILVRTNSVTKANDFVEKYNTIGISLKVVNYQKTNTQNELALKNLNAGIIDGLVCVGMLGEGLDLPELDILTFHDIPRSFPFTIQFIGRISRRRPDERKAHIIASTKNFAPKMKKLFEEDNDWGKLITNLSERLIQGEVTASTFSLNNLTLFIQDLKPFFSVRLYKVSVTDLDFSIEYDLRNVQMLLRESYKGDNNFLVTITQRSESPYWVNTLPLRTERYDLHIYYYHENSGVLFESSTSQYISNLILKRIINTELKRVNPRELFKILSLK